MKKLHLILVILILAFSTLYFCNRESRTEGYRVVSLSGGQPYAKLINPYLLVNNDPEGVSALPLYDQDVIIMAFGENDEGYFRYSLADGASLRFRKDGFRLFANDRLVSVTLSNDPEVIDWMNSATSAGTKGLRSLVVGDSLGPAALAALGKLAKVRNVPGLVFGDKAAPGQMVEILSLFRLDWLYGVRNLSPAGMEKLYSENSLHCLMIQADCLDRQGLIHLDNLTTLIIKNFKAPVDGGKLELPPNLKRLAFDNSDFRNVDFLTWPSALKGIFFLDCKSLTDISALSQQTGLVRLAFIGADSLGDLAALDGIPGITGISFPSGITNEGFAGFVRNHPHLKSVELVGCEKVTSLEPLQDRSGLACMSFVDNRFPMEDLYRFKRLDYLAYPMDLPKDSLTLRDLRSRLPDTVIVPSLGLCLGTGWLLLFFPLFGIILSFRLWRRKRTILK
jgi:hypothetical protein